MPVPDPRVKKRKLLIILAHPRRPSLCGALAEAYGEGARAAGMEVEALDLGAMAFDPDVHPVSPCDQPLEPDLEQARRRIEWAEHLTFVYPAWWGVGPARLKGFLDRVLLPGFAFRERDDGRFEGLLGGRTAHLITALDMPPWVYRFIYRAPGHQAMRRSTLGFCGIETTRILSLGPVKDSEPADRAAWLEQARALGFSLRDGPRGLLGRAAGKLRAWLKALRLQFYPMTWIAYSLGALGATGQSTVDTTLFWLGYACLFFIEAATVFTNEWFDYESDRRNRFFGPFNGGSRVLVDGDISFRELRMGILLALGAAALCAGWLLETVPEAMPAALLLAGVVTLGLGYTAPPLKLAWRGLGELNVAFTHSVAVILCGYLFQGGSWSAAFPWLVGVPLLLAVLPAITLSGVPDWEADGQAGKRTLPVQLGLARTRWLTIVLVIAAPIAVLLLKDLPSLRGALDGLLPWILPHALLLVWLIHRALRRAECRGIDGLMVAALSYIVWFGLIPVLNLL